MRCRFAWYSTFRGREVQCWHEQGHGGRHQAWSSRRERREHPNMGAWVAVRYEGRVPSGRWLEPIEQEQN